MLLGTEKLSDADSRCTNESAFLISRHPRQKKNEIFVFALVCLLLMFASVFVLSCCSRRACIKRWQRREKCNVKHFQFIKRSTGKKNSFGVLCWEQTYFLCSLKNYCTWQKSYWCWCYWFFPVCSGTQHSFSLFLLSDITALQKLIYSMDQLTKRFWNMLRHGNTLHCFKRLFLLSLHWRFCDWNESFSSDLDALQKLVITLAHGVVLQASDKF